MKYATAQLGKWGSCGEIHAEHDEQRVHARQSRAVIGAMSARGAHLIGCTSDRLWVSDNTEFPVNMQRSTLNSGTQDEGITGDISGTAGHMSRSGEGFELHGPMFDGRRVEICVSYVSS